MAGKLFELVCVRCKFWYSGVLYAVAGGRMHGRKPEATTLPPEWNGWQRQQLASSVPHHVSQTVRGKTKIVRRDRLLPCHMGLPPTVIPEGFQGSDLPDVGPGGLHHQAEQYLYNSVLLDDDVCLGQRQVIHSLGALQGMAVGGSPMPGERRPSLNNLGLAPHRLADMVRC